MYGKQTDGTFDYFKFYGKSSDSYKQEIIDYFSDNFLNDTIDIINKLMTENNVGNWVRRAGSQNEFLDELQKITTQPKYSKIFRTFVEKFKTVPKQC